MAWVYACGDARLRTKMFQLLVLGEPCDVQDLGSGFRLLRRKALASRLASQGHFHSVLGQIVSCAKHGSTSRSRQSAHQADQTVFEPSPAGETERMGWYAGGALQEIRRQMDAQPLSLPFLNSQRRHQSVPVHAAARFRNHFQHQQKRRLGLADRVLPSPRPVLRVRKRKCWAEPLAVPRTEGGSGATFLRDIVSASSCSSR